MFFVLSLVTLFNAPLILEVFEMAYSEGVGRNTQITQIAGFFFGLATLSFLGIKRNNPVLLQVGALIFMFAFGVRILAVFTSEAGFAPYFITPLICSLILYQGAKSIKSN